MCIFLFVIQLIDDTKNLSRKNKEESCCEFDGCGSVIAVVQDAFRRCDSDGIANPVAAMGINKGWICQYEKIICWA